MAHWPFPMESRRGIGSIATACPWWLTPSARERLEERCLRHRVGGDTSSQNPDLEELATPDLRLLNSG
jgi:hypothetical protein